MARHTFVVSGGLRVEIQPAKTTSGAVLLSILHSSGDRFGCATIAASTAAVIAQALELEAVTAENAGLVELAGQKCGCGSVHPKCGAHSCRGREIAAAQKAVKKIGPALVQAYADTNGVPPMRALPVLDVAQVGA